MQFPNSQPAEYNRRVLNYLRKIAPHHADELNAFGAARGWWDQISYFRVTGKTVPECAHSIRTIRLCGPVADGARIEAVIEHKAIHGS